jgi:hypothetical protein
VEEDQGGMTMVHEVVQEYIEPLSSVISQERKSALGVESVKRVHIGTQDRDNFIWAFLMDVLRATGLFMLTMMASIGLDRGSHYLSPESPHGLPFVITVAAAILLGLNLIFFMMSLTRSFLRLVYRA